MGHRWIREPGAHQLTEKYRKFVQAIWGYSGSLMVGQLINGQCMGQTIFFLSQYWQTLSLKNDVSPMHGPWVGNVA
jgi:hypothetical protein